jgi:CheY-like chemotaxis protein
MAQILVVEDNALTLKLVTVLLTRAGHEVVPAHDASEAERALARSTPELILMDLGLPGKDGFTLTRELRQRPSTQTVPILVVTSFAMPGDEAKAIRAGCTGFLTKPIDSAVFLARVQSLIAQPSPPLPARPESPA